MKTKVKITLSVGFLFLLIIILGGLGVFYTNQMSSETQNILADNYKSIEYSRAMLIELDKLKTDASAKSNFEKNLKLQQSNVTEIGEELATNNLTSDFEKLKSNLQDSGLFVNLRRDLANIIWINMEAIERKSEVAKNTSQNAAIIISTAAALCFILAFTLLVNLPSNIANPIKELTESVQAIAEGNYAERVHFESHSEFGDLAHSFNVMAEKLEKYNQSNLAKLMTEKIRIETLINNMLHPIIMLDENMSIIFINEEALKVSGLKFEEVKGKNAQEVAIYNDLIRSLIQDIIKPDSENKKPELPLKIFANNKESYFEKEIIPIFITPTAEKQAKNIGNVIILQNITPFKELDFAKTNFIATISHELKTPIASILMSVELIKNEKIGTMNHEQTQLIQSVKEDGERLLKITADLLNMTQVESGKIQLNIQNSSVKEIIRYSTVAVKMHAEQKNITFDIHCPENIPSVFVDAEKTAWVVTNLLSNAIRYSYENATILITVTQTNDKVTLSVQDFGNGIDSKYIPLLFDRYFQVPGSNKTGTGLGLAISKEFIEAQGGTISAQSEIGKGSIFSIVMKK